MAKSKSPTTWILTEEGERIRTKDYAPVPPDETEIVYVDSNGNTQRVLRTEYKG